MHRVLHVARHIRNERRKLVLIERVGDSSAILALSDIGRLLKLRLQFCLTSSPAHVRHRHERPRLGPRADRAMRGIRLDRMVPQNGVHVHRRRGPPIARRRGHGGLLIGDVIRLGGGGYEVRHLVDAGTLTLLVLDRLIAGVVVDSRELLDLEGRHL